MIGHNRLYCAGWFGRTSARRRARRRSGRTSGCPDTPDSIIIPSTYSIIPSMTTFFDSIFIFAQEISMKNYMRKYRHWQYFKNDSIFSWQYFLFFFKIWQYFFAQRTAVFFFARLRKIPSGVLQNTVIRHVISCSHWRVWARSQRYTGLDRIFDGFDSIFDGFDRMFENTVIGQHVKWFHWKLQFLLTKYGHA